MALLASVVMPLLACGADVAIYSIGGAGEGGVTSSAGGHDSSGGIGGAGGQAGHSGGSGGDVVDICAVSPEQLDGAVSCATTSPDSIELTQKWRFPQGGMSGGAIAGNSLVANLTDDNGDGTIDLCDEPDVLTCYGDGIDPVNNLVVLSGVDGTLLYKLDAINGCAAAIADLDSDGTPEIVAVSRDGYLTTLSPSGDVLWQNPEPIYDYPLSPSATVAEGILFDILKRTLPAIHDLEGDGFPEIIVGLSVFEYDGTLRFSDQVQATDFAAGEDENWIYTAWAPIMPTVADLDGDSSPEVLFGHVTYDSSGTELWRLDPALGPTFAHPGDFDGDKIDEILMVGRDGIFLVSAGGDILWGPAMPPNETTPPLYDCWIHPAALYDFDGDGLPEAMVNSCEHRMVLSITTTGFDVLRSEPTPVTSSFGTPMDGSTAFGFRSSGPDWSSPDWLAYNYDDLDLFAGISTTIMSNVDPFPGNNGGGVTFPRVADVDNDGSADVIIGNDGKLVVYEDQLRRRSPARRIWNQYNYRSSYIREDAIVVPYDQSPTAQDMRVQHPIECL